MGRLGGCADLNLGTPVLGEPESRSVKEVMKGGGVKVNPAAWWSKLPVVEEAAAMAKEPRELSGV